MKEQVQNIRLLTRKLETVSNIFELPTNTTSQKELFKFAESLMQKVDFEALNELDKKYMQVLEWFDYELYEIKGTGFYMLKDCQCNMGFHNGDLCNSIFNSLDYFGENWFEDHNLDMFNVFDDEIKDFSECILEVW